MTSPNSRDIRLNIKVDADGNVLPPIVKGLGDTAKQADKAGDSLKGMGDDAKSLNVQIAESTKRIHALRTQLVELGNDKEIRKALRGEESWLRELTKIQSATEMPGLSFAAPSMRALRGPAIGGLVGIVAGIAPAIGAAVSGAVVGAVGAGGIIGGVVAASKDSQVKAAWADFASGLTAEAFGGPAFVQPTVEAIRELDKAFDDIGLGDALAKMAPFTENLAEGLGDLARNIMPGVNKVFDQGGPIIDAVAKGLGETGDAVSHMLTVMVDSEGTIEGVNTAFGALGGTIRGVGNAAAFLGDSWDWMVKNDGAFAGMLEDIPGWLQAVVPPLFLVADGAERANNAFESVQETLSGSNLGETIAEFFNPERPTAYEGTLLAAAEAWTGIRDRIQEATRAQDDYFNSAMAVPEAQDAFQASIDEFTESLKENGRTFDSNTEKGRANRDAMREMVETAQLVRTRMIEQGQSVADANRKYDENIAKIEAIASQAGVTAAQLREMAGDYHINIYTKDVRTVSYFTTGSPNIDMRRGFAAGSEAMGPTPAFEPFRVHDGEVLFSSRQHYVASKRQVDAMSGGGGTYQITVNVPPTVNTAEVGGAVVRAIQDYESRNGTSWRN